MADETTAPAAAVTDPAPAEAATPAVEPVAQAAAVETAPTAEQIAFTDRAMLLWGELERHITSADTALANAPAALVTAVLAIRGA